MKDTSRGHAAPCGLRGCKNRAHSVSWLEVVKGVPNQGVDCFVSQGSFFCVSFVFLVYVVLCLIVFGCQYRCNWLPGKTRLQNDLLCVEWDVKPYTLTRSHAPISHQGFAPEPTHSPHNTHDPSPTFFSHGLSPWLSMAVYGNMDEKRVFWC